MGRKKKEDKAPKKEKDSLDSALARIEKQFGKGAVMKIGNNCKLDVEAIPTGSLALDLALGVGGVPRGRVIELYGTESSGKTTLALSIVKNIQQSGGVASYIDAEHAIDIDYAKTIGVNFDELLFSQPDSGEQALTILQELVESNKVDVIIVDSVASLVPQAEIDGEMGDAHIALQARLMSQALRKLTASISRTKTCVIFINQIRMKIGVMFGNPETTPGGRALKFYASIRIDLRRTGTVKRGEDFIGSKVRAKIAKNKVAPPFKKAEFEIYYDEGISYNAEILNLAIKHGIVGKAGSWLSFEEENIGQGVDKSRHILKENPGLLKKIETQVFNLLGLKEAK